MELVQSLIGLCVAVSLTWGARLPLYPWPQRPPVSREGRQNLNHHSHEHRRWLLSRVTSYIIPVRHSDPKWSGIPVGNIIESPICPPPPATRSLSICYLATCRSHQECPNSQGCCFNGCIHTCMDPLDRPAAFDWIEDTNKILPILGDDATNETFQPIRIPQKPPGGYLAAEGEAEEVVLPGGCILTASQHKELKQFMTASSIKDCGCNGSEVVCDVISVKPLSS